MTEQSDNKQKIFNMALAIVAGQGGCVTLIIILAAVLLGLWVDNINGTKPWFTLMFLLVSVPISLASMFLVVRSAIGRIKTDTSEEKPMEDEEETGID
jgi:F0F1-type ATP synthase assembly protein I